MTLQHVVWTLLWRQNVKLTSLQRCFNVESYLGKECKVKIFTSIYVRHTNSLWSTKQNKMKVKLFFIIQLAIYNAADNTRKKTKQIIIISFAISMIALVIKPQSSNKNQPTKKKKINSLIIFSLLVKAM